MYLIPPEIQSVRDFRECIWQMSCGQGGGMDAPRLKQEVEIGEGGRNDTTSIT